MATTPIPPWNARGVLPPNDPLDPAGSDRSPYPVPLLDLVMRFATLPERRAILQGLLDFRAAGCHAAAGSHADIRLLVQRLVASQNCGMEGVSSSRSGPT
jgi:hypothetical protein